MRTSDGRLVQVKSVWHLPHRSRQNLGRIAEGFAGDLGNDLVGRGLAAEAVVADESLMADGRHLDGVAVPHNGQGRQDGPRGEVGIVDEPAGLVEHLLVLELDGL